MNKTQAQSSVQKVQNEIFSLNPSALVTLFEIDLTNLIFDMGLGSATDLDIGEETVFRFHGNFKLTNSNIVWQGNTFYAAPIYAEGFESNIRGTLPQPKLSISVNDSAVSALTTLKEKIYVLNDIVGARVTRIRTFARFLDSQNFIGMDPPPGFDPDPYAELSRDVYYVDRKLRENKFTLEYELGSILDVEGVQLPGRLMLAERCPFTYRGEGCLYEYNSRRVLSIHGSESRATLPTSAPPVATELDKKISEILGVNIVDKGEYDKNAYYTKGDSVYILRSGIKYYFVARANNPADAVGAGASGHSGLGIFTQSFPPPNRKYWILDACSKTIFGCKCRYSTINNGRLPFGGFPGANKIT